MHVTALLRKGSVRALRIRSRRVVRRARALIGAWRHKSQASEPVRTFSVPSGLSSVGPSLTIALTATALVACTTAALGTLLMASWTDDPPPGPEPSALVQTPSGGWVSGGSEPMAPIQGEAATPVEPESTGLKEQIPTGVVGTPPEPKPPEIGHAEVSPPPVGGAAPAAPSPAVSGGATQAGSAQAGDVAPVGSIAKSRSSPISEGPYAGVWGTDEKACSPQLNRHGLLPALINAQGAWAGETTCSFKTGKRVGNTWTFAAVCSDTRRRWKTNVRMSVAGNRLTWKSQRGSQTYVRCQQGLLQAHERDNPIAPA